MKTLRRRICIYPKDIQLVTGKSYRQSTRIYQEMKVILNRSEKQMLSIVEFCQHTGLNQKEVELMIFG